MTTSKRSGRSLTDALFQTKYETKVASELCLNLDGQEYRLVGKIIRLGRAMDNDIVLEHRSCSRYHAMITRNGNDVILEDLKSRNGVQVNGERIAQASLNDNDEIQIGDLKGIFFQKTKIKSPQELSQLESSTDKVFSKVKEMRLKSKLRNINPKLKLLFVAMIPIFLFFGLLFFSANAKKSNASVAQVKTTYDVLLETIVDAPIKRADFNKCIESEDLGNYRRSRACFNALPLTEEVNTALKRVIKTQARASEKLFKEGKQANDYFYYDLAILKWEQVLLIAADDSEFRVDAEKGIQEASLRQRAR